MKRYFASKSESKEAKEKTKVKGWYKKAMILILGAGMTFFGQSVDSNATTNVSNTLFDNIPAAKQILQNIPVFGSIRTAEAAKKATANQTVKKATTKKTTAKKSTTKKAVKKATAKKKVTKKSTAKQTVKKATTKQTVAKKATVKQTAKKATEKQTIKKVATKQTVTQKTTRKTVKKASTKQTVAKKSTAKQTSKNTTTKKTVRKANNRVITVNGIMQNGKIVKKDFGHGVVQVITLKEFRQMSKLRKEEEARKLKAEREKFEEEARIKAQREKQREIFENTKIKIRVNPKDANSEEVEVSYKELKMAYRNAEMQYQMVMEQYKRESQISFGEKYRYIADKRKKEIDNINFLHKLMYDDYHQFPNTIKLWYSNAYYSINRLLANIKNFNQYYCQIQKLDKTQVIVAYSDVLDFIETLPLCKRDGMLAHVQTIVARIDDDDSKKNRNKRSKSKKTQKCKNVERTA